MNAPAFLHPSPSSELARLPVRCQLARYGSDWIAKREAADAAEGRTDTVQFGGPVWKDRRRVADSLSCDASEARAQLRAYCAAHGITAAMLGEIAGEIS